MNKIFQKTINYISENYYNLKLNEDDSNHKNKLQSIDFEEAIKYEGQHPHQELASELFTFINAQKYSKSQLQAFMDYTKLQLFKQGINLENFQSIRDIRKPIFRVDILIIDSKGYKLAKGKPKFILN